MCVFVCACVCRLVDADDCLLFLISHSHSQIICLHAHSFPSVPRPSLFALWSRDCQDQTDLLVKDKQRLMETKKEAVVDENGEKPDPSHSCVCVPVCLCVCVRACVRACVFVPLSRLPLTFMTSSPASPPPFCLSPHPCTGSFHQNCC